MSGGRDVPASHRHDGWHALRRLRGTQKGTRFVSQTVPGLPRGHAADLSSPLHFDKGSVFTLTPRSVRTVAHWAALVVPALPARIAACPGRPPDTSPPAAR